VPAISAERRYGLITVADDDEMYCRRHLFF
jgi:hypothetical protein